MDKELENLRNLVDCRSVLECAGWELDKAQSSVNATKYRGGSAQIVIVTHHGKGWFDPLADARGDVIALAQYVWGGSLGHARKALRPLAGIAPSIQARQPLDKESFSSIDAPKTWTQAKRIAQGSQCWNYLNSKRGLPASTLHRAIQAELVREGICGTVWALHRSSSGEPSGWEMRGPQYKGFSKGGAKSLFWIGGLATARRVAVTESAIDALSLATLEDWPDSTVYFSTGGGFGPRTKETISTLLPEASRLVAATDQGEGGEMLAQRLREIAIAKCAGFGRLRPVAKDWNAQLIGE